MSKKILSKMEWQRILEKEIPEAEMVLVGLCEEFDDCGEEKDLSLVESVLVECEAGWLLPEIRNVYRKYDKMYSEDAKIDHENKRMNSEDEQIVTENEQIDILKELADRLQGKNYYVLCLATNEEIAKISWREGRLVAPCGFGTKKQCGLACEGEEPKELTEEEKNAMEIATREFLTSAGLVNAEKRSSEDKKPKVKGNLAQGQWGDLPPQVREAMEMIQRREKIRMAASEYKKKCEEILGTCPNCGAQEVLNDMLAPKYDQRGYLADWTKYTKWLYGSMNRKLLILGLGTSRKHPELLQGAFQKMEELHTKATYYQLEMLDL